jgi:hypothetical protein
MEMKLIPHLQLKSMYAPKLRLGILVTNSVGEKCHLRITKLRISLGTLSFLVMGTKEYNFQYCTEHYTKDCKTRMLNIWWKQTKNTTTKTGFT